MEDDHLLVDFERPPIAEVVAAVSFKNLPDSALGHFGAFWKSELSSHFPKVQERPPYHVQVERFGREALIPKFELSLEEYPPPRLWFLNESGDELLQLQKNWFACNWRKVSSDSFYSHWPERQESFLRWFSAFERYAEENDLGPLEIEQCEVTYINHIEAGDTWKVHGQLDKILKIMSPPSGLELGLEQEKTLLNQQYIVKTDEGQPLARLHVTAQPAFVTATRAPIYILELTVRGTPEGKEREDYINFFRRSRHVIVTTFANITTDAIKREWGMHDRHL